MINYVRKVLHLFWSPKPNFLKRVLQQVQFALPLMLDFFCLQIHLEQNLVINIGYIALSNVDTDQVGQSTEIKSTAYALV